MALTQICDHKKKLLVTTLGGEITGPELMEAYSSIYMQPKFDEQFDQLWDCRYIDELKIDQDDLSGLKELANTFCPAHGEPGKLAIIATKNEVIGTARALIASTEKKVREKEVFYSLKEGLEWLGIKTLPAYLLN